MKNKSKKQTENTDSSTEKLLLSDVINSNNFGKLVKNKSTTKNCCEQCKYSEYNGEHDACNTCAFDSAISLNYYYL